MTALQIPQHVVLNQTVTLECDFNLDKESLYAVKWYKDGKEFYRFVPREVPSVQVFSLPGFSVDVSSSSIKYNSIIIKTLLMHSGSFFLVKIIHFWDCFSIFLFIQKCCQSSKYWNRLRNGVKKKIGQKSTAIRQKSSEPKESNRIILE